MTQRLKKIFRTLPQSFYDRSAAAVAPELLGKWLVRRMPEGFAGGPIVEVEAYLKDDPACHAVRGQTRRNAMMFGPPGTAYIYYIYGAHYCVNAVCMPSGIGEAVLIRAIQPELGTNRMFRRRKALIPRLTNGPGKLCAALDIDLALNGLNLCDPEGELFIVSTKAEATFLAATGPTVISERIGITKGFDLPLRFYLQNSRFLSRPIPRLS